MKDKIATILPKDKHILSEINYPEIHIVDWKDFDKTKGIEILDKKPAINSVCLLNNSELAITFDAFGENALPIKKGEQARQCECIAFPSDSSSSGHWILAIETKYANDEDAAFKKDYDYPKSMVEQIVSTVDFFREKEIIDKNKLVHAIISFPNLIADFNSTLFSIVEKEKEEWSEDNLILYKKIRIKGCNSATIISNKHIKV